MASTSKNIKMGSFATGGKLGGKYGQLMCAAKPLSPDTDVPPATLVIPIIKTKECAKQLPVYTSALGKSADEPLAAEDLDNIQVEFETMLSNVALRYRVLKSEYESLDKDEKIKDKKKLAMQIAAGEKQPASPATAMSSSGKRKRDESLMVRKPKHKTLKQTKNTHAKNSPLAPQTDDSLDYAPTVHGAAGRDSQQKPIPAKIDTPNKFWLSVEPYCMPLTNEDLRLLDDLLEQYNGPLVPPIPELGPHYSEMWAAEDMKEIQQASNPNASNRLKPQNHPTINMLKKADSMMDECVTGPLTQRLVSALMEEHLLPNPADVVGDNSNSSSENTHSSAQMNFRSLSMLRNCIGIEKRLKKELIEQGILDISDFPNDDEDEIHSEIKRLVGELSAVAEYNSNALKRLREGAEQEIKRLEVKRKLDAIDQELLETYKRTLQNKAKRKPLSPEEQQEIYRLTAEQKNLADQLERMQLFPSEDY